MYKEGSPEDVLSADRGTARAPFPKGSGIASVGLVFAVIGAVLSYVPHINLRFGFPCWALGVVFSIIGWGESGESPGKKGRKIGIAGVVVSVATVLFIVRWTMLWGWL